MARDTSVQAGRSRLSQDVRRLMDSLGALPEPAVNPGFVVVSGLPGTGKSYFCRKLADRLPFCILESDALRKVLCGSPNYSPEESARLFAACHVLIEQLLREGVPVIFDATNLSEYHREHLYAISHRTKAKLVLVLVEAPSELVYERLRARNSGLTEPVNSSDADWGVYLRMKPRLDRIQRNHLVVDTSRDIGPVIDKIVRLVSC